MRRLLLTFAAALLALLLLAPPAWAGWIWPVRGDVITPYRYGPDPYAAGQHRGIDIAGEAGATVVAATDGEVRFAGTAGSSGLTVSIRTRDGRHDTSYLHLSSASVTAGDAVEAGQPLGTVGTTGSRTTSAPHLHFGVREAGSRHGYADPLRFLPPRAPGSPRGAPFPEPAPAPVGPAPAPAPARPSLAPAPVGPAPHPAHPSPATPRLGPAPAPALAPARAPMHEPAPAPMHARTGARGPVPAPMHAPTHARGPHPVPLPAHPTPAVTPDPGPTGADPGPIGPEPALLAACLCLLGVAILASARERRNTARAAVRHVPRLLRPVLGRR